jgi:diguanylate cyclase (GGDEF)-like protein
MCCTAQALLRVLEWHDPTEPNDCGEKVAVCAMPDPEHPNANTSSTILVDLAWQQPGRHELATRIADLLTAISSRICTTEGSLSPVQPIDLVLSERPGALAELSLATLGVSEEAILAGNVGLVVLGASDHKADAQLPLDVSNRELLLTCRLVLEIVTLRRRSVAVERKSDELARLATIDPLTRIANRRGWDQEGPDRYRRARVAGDSVCLAIFDIDYFKRINDTRGYATGDASLSAMGHDINTLLRTDDLLARLGGDEFSILMVGKLDSAAALAIVERVRAGVGRLQTSRLGFELSLSAGCALANPGGALLPEDGVGLAALFVAADLALRQAKQSGRNRSALG